MLGFLADILFPVRSLGGVPGVWITPEEWRYLAGQPERIEGVSLRRMGCIALDALLSGDRYARSPLLRLAVHRVKYRRSTVLATPLVAILLRAVQALGIAKDTVLCPVPLHWARHFVRGFNQADILAQAIAPVLGCDVRTLLTRRRPTGAQAKRRTHEERREAMRDAFIVPESLARPLPSSVLLIDDIFTSGATLDACAQALKQAGVQRVEALVVARG